VITIGEYLTPKQVADKFNVPVTRVYSALKDGRLEGEKIGWSIVIHKDKLPKKWPGRSSS
jgi:excisionase family DNA binding protein